MLGSGRIGIFMTVIYRAHELFEMTMVEVVQLEIFEGKIRSSQTCSLRNEIGPILRSKASSSLVRLQISLVL